MTRRNPKKTFDSDECENCGELTFVKPWNGKPDYCGVCGHDLEKQRTPNSVLSRGEADD